MQPQIAVRASQTADVAGIQRLLLDAYEPRLRPYLTYTQAGIGAYLSVVLSRPDLYPSHALLSAVDGEEQVVGFAEFRHLGSGTTLLSWFAVDEAARGEGLGSRIVRHAASTFPADLLQVDVFDSNAGARRFYDRLGFEPVADSTWLVRALPSGSDGPGALDVTSWHEARAGLHAYGFCRVQAVWRGVMVTVGLLGPSTVRVDDRELFEDLDFLGALRATFPERKEAVRVTQDLSDPGPETAVLLRSTRLQAARTRLS